MHPRACCGGTGTNPVVCVVMLRLQSISEAYQIGLAPSVRVAVKSTVKDRAPYALANRLVTVYCPADPSITVRRSYFKDQNMSHAVRIAIVAAFIAALGGISTEASARGRLYPVTRCGPDLAYLCPIHGYFDQAPFHYKVAVYPGCIKMVAVETPNGIERHRSIVCGAPERSMIWW